MISFKEGFPRYQLVETILDFNVIVPGCYLKSNEIVKSVFV